MTYDACALYFKNNLVIYKVLMFRSYWCILWNMDDVAWTTVLQMFLAFLFLSLDSSYRTCTSMVISLWFTAMCHFPVTPWTWSTFLSYSHKTFSSWWLVIAVNLTSLMINHEIMTPGLFVRASSSSCRYFESFDKYENFD